MIGKLGWRPTYTLMGALGVGLGVIGNILVKEPHLRLRFQAKYRPEQKYRKVRSRSRSSSSSSSGDEVKSNKAKLTKEGKLVREDVLPEESMI